ncbi:MAG: hypothetical protein AAF959_00095 [Cyanobacteria bacterium P01_D01_bin.56]
MDTDSLRMLWQIISHLSPDSIISVAYEDLVADLVAQLNQQKPLSSEDWLNIHSYLLQKKMLIYELLTD